MKLKKIAETGINKMEEKKDKKENKSNKDKQGLRTYIVSVIIFIVTIAGTGLCSVIFGQETHLCIRNCVTAGLGSGAVICLMALAKEKKLYAYDNNEYCERFLICYLVALLISFICGKLPAEGWPFVAIFVLLSLFSNYVIGICSGSILLTISIMLSGESVEIFLLYFVSSVVAVCVFKGLDENYKVGIPVIVSLIALIVGITAEIILFENAKLSMEMFIIPLINVIITCILLIVILKVFSYLVIFKYRERYMEINDPECPLLVQLKEKSKEEYYKAIHTAYLSDKIARKLGFDDKVTKAGGYYHRIGCLKGENTWDNVNEICVEYKFPPEVLVVLKEYLEKDSKIIHKETAVIYFAEAVVSSILFLIAQDRDVKLDYNQIIDTVFEKKQEKAVFLQCDITVNELNQMKKIFKGEKLYYDFLR